MSHIFSITLRWARPGSCAGDHRYQKVLTTVRSAVSREIHAPRRKEVNWRKTITISYILSWCLGRVDISIVMIYLDILLIILDTVNNNHIIPINTIYIYTYIRVCVFVCVPLPVPLFRTLECTIIDTGRHQPAWPSGDRSHGDRWRKVGPRQTPRCSAWGLPGLAVWNRDVSVTNCMGPFAWVGASWMTIVNQASPASPAEICNYQWLPTSSNTSRGQLNPWSILKPRGR